MGTYNIDRTEYNREALVQLRPFLQEEEEKMNHIQHNVKHTLKKGNKVLLLFLLPFLLIILLIIASVFFGKTDVFLPILMALMSLIGFCTGPALIIVIVVMLVKNTAKVQTPIKEMKAYYTEHVVKPVIAKVFPNCRYFPQYDLRTDWKYDDVMKKDIIVSDNRPSEDRLYGIYRDVPFEQTDVYMDKLEATEDESFPVHGSVLCIELDKEIDGEVVLLSKRKAGSQSVGHTETMYHNQKGVMVTQRKSAEQYYGLPRVHMENVEFDEHFYVYAANPTEAFYLLTPHFMERIQKLYGKYGFRIRVKGRNLFLIKERATFELNVRNEVHIDTEISRIQEDILDIYETIDCLLGD